MGGRVTANPQCGAETTAGPAVGQLCGDLFTGPETVGIRNFAYVCTQVHSEDRRGRWVPWSSEGGEPPSVDSGN